MNLRKPLLATPTATRPAANKMAPTPAVDDHAPRLSWPRNPGRVRAEKTAPAGQRPSEQRYHQTIRRIDLWSVLKVSVCFYLCALLVILVAGVMVWFVADTAGVIHKVESFVGDLFDDKGFKFFPSEILRAGTLLGLVFASLATVMTVLATGFYNLFSDLIGGIEITVAEES